MNTIPLLLGRKSPETCWYANKSIKIKSIVLSVILPDDRENVKELFLSVS